ncbi:uncharacterized protein LY79DRAFT_560955 [Colletotrichum navitas]|uniref:Uncharacterized protein n=1 Tax=Colletotrichum navitas TaxID=681940 RepID=A0AAD8V2B4_9PEZI|nr:uncharacterized protein LY79DRAFT_560955 [Colletotrichum navitas]KAK1580612.1 hypothetical protein LY79DRAFT_560955 [Colletotrichum navitas]
MLPACSSALIHNQPGRLRRDSSPQPRQHHRPNKRSPHAPRAWQSEGVAGPNHHGMACCGGLEHYFLLLQHAPAGAYNQSTHMSSPSRDSSTKGPISPETRGHFPPEPSLRLTARVSAMLFATRNLALTASVAVGRPREPPRSVRAGARVPHRPGALRTNMTHPP